MHVECLNSDKSSHAISGSDLVGTKNDGKYEEKKFSLS